MQYFLDHCCKVITKLSFRNFIEIHKYCHKWSLSIGCHKRDHLILDHLNSAVDLLFDTHLSDLVYHLFCRLDTGSCQLLADSLTELLTAHIHKWCQMCQSKGLTAVLVTCNLCDRLCCNIACGRKALWTVDHRLTDHCAVLKHVL